MKNLLQRQPAFPLPTGRSRLAELLGTDGNKTVHPFWGWVPLTSLTSVARPSPFGSQGNRSGNRTGGAFPSGSRAGGSFPLLACLFFSLAGCGKAAEPLVVLFCLDGASPWLVDELRDEGKLPTLNRLMEAGVSGPLRSIESVRLSLPQAQRGLISPAVWTSVATGVTPARHGILDFVLPRSGSSFVWIGSRKGRPRAALELGEISGRPPFRLRFRVRAHAKVEKQTLEVVFNGVSLGRAPVGKSWEEGSFALPESLARPSRNRVTFRFARQFRPSGAEKKKDDRPLAGALAKLAVVDGKDRVVLELDPVLDRVALGHGFYPPEAEFVDVQSSDWRAPPIWSSLGELGHEVGIVGQWATWPAYRVNGFLVSSYMGLLGVGKRGELPGLTWPPELADRLLPLVPPDSAVTKILRDLYPEGCQADSPERLEAFRSVIWQDEFYDRIAQELLPTMEGGLFSIYFEAIDVASHDFLPLRAGEPLPEGCPESVRQIVDEVYRQTDQRMERLLRLVPDDAVILVLSDHGLVSRGRRGSHIRDGIFVAKGPKFRKGARIHGASVLDIAPTLFHLFREEIPLAMDGQPLVQIFEAKFLESHPPRWTARTFPLPDVEAPGAGVNEELMERLEGIGYMD